MALISLIVNTILLLNISYSLCFVHMSNSTGLATWYGTETGAGKGN